MKLPIFIILFIISLTTTCFAQSNYVDTMFGVNGVSDTDITSSTIEETYHGFTVTNSDKIVNLSVRSDNVTLISQHNANGTLDTNFGTNGILELTGFLGFDLVTNSSDEIFICGISASSAKLGIIALDNTGDSITSFGTNGIADIGENILASIGFVIKIDNNDKFIVAGKVPVVDEDQLVVARFNSDGTMDNSFESNGVFLVNVSSIISEEELGIQNLSILPDNSMLITGNVYTPEDQDPLGDLQYNEFAVKVTSSGTLDSSFDSDGIAIFYSLTESQGDVYASYVLPNNQIMLSISGQNSSSVNGLIKINTNGTIDTSFGTNGLLNLVNNNFEIDHLFSTSIDSDILALGESNHNDLSVLKIDNDGNLDTTFGVNGILPVDFPSVGVSTTDLVSKAIELPDGKLLVSGIRENADGFIMARYFKENQLDIEENTFLNSVSIFPNPVDNSLSISSEVKIDSLKIYQIDGKLIFEENFNFTKELNIDVANYNKGIYLARITGENSIQTFKFIKK